MLLSSSAHREQLKGSIEKLLHYLFVYAKYNTKVEVAKTDVDGTRYVLFEKVYRVPGRVSISPTLYTRLDDCHGAGNCCRVPFDLVYTEYDRSRIVNYDAKDIAERFGADSAKRFDKNREDLLASLEELSVHITVDGFNHKHNILSKLYVKQNVDEYELSGRCSCPYLFIGGDRYFCGVHPFKPLHCWYPHMTVRATEPEDQNEMPTVSIGRMQYGRNWAFGCPVVLTQANTSIGESIFIDKSNIPSYFDSQFGDDIAKLEWTSKSAASLGLTSSDALTVGIHEDLRDREREIRMHIKNETFGHIVLWGS